MALDFDSYAPFDSGPGASVNEDGWRSMQRRTGNPGVIRDSLNGLLCYGDSTGMQVKVKSGEVWAEGIWGAITPGDKILSIASAASIPGGQSRKDLVVWRLDATNNKYVLDVITGTPAVAPQEPNITRNSSIYEGPIATVLIPSSATTTITATQVLDARWYGGPTVPTLADDWTIYGDKISTAQRNNIAGVDACPTGNTFVTLTVAQRDTVATTIRYLLTTARSGGFADCRVYTGYSRHRLYDATGNINITDTAAAGLHNDALPSPLSISAGRFVAIAYISTVTSTAPQLGRTAPVISSEMLNPSTTTLDPLGRWSSVFKTGQTTLPSILQIHDDGNWSKRDRSFWFALA